MADGRGVRDVSGKGRERRERERKGKMVSRMNFCGMTEYSVIRQTRTPMYVYPKQTREHVPRQNYERHEYWFMNAHTSAYSSKHVT
jgi:hypothetical protein